MKVMNVTLLTPSTLHLHTGCNIYSMNLLDKRIIHTHNWLEKDDDTRFHPTTQKGHFKYIGSLFLEFSMNSLEHSWPCIIETLGSYIMN